MKKLSKSGERTCNTKKALKIILHDSILPLCLSLVVVIFFLLCFFGIPLLNKYVSITTLVLYVVYAFNAFGVFMLLVFLYDEIKRYLAKVCKQSISGE